MSDTVTLTHRNVCKDGFTVTDEADASAWPLYGAGLSLSNMLITQLRRYSLPRLACPLGSHRARKESTQGRCPFSPLHTCGNPCSYRRNYQKDRITRICCFSPCMEQVLRTVSALNEANFTGTPMRAQNHSATQTPVPTHLDLRLMLIFTILRYHDVRNSPSAIRSQPSPDPPAYQRCLPETQTIRKTP